MEWEYLPNFKIFGVKTHAKKHGCFQLYWSGIPILHCNAPYQIPIKQGSKLVHCIVLPNSQTTTVVVFSCGEARENSHQTIEPCSFHCSRDIGLAL